MQITTPITDYARYFTLHPNMQMRHLCDAIMKYVLHACDNYETRETIRALVKESPSTVGDILYNLRGDMGIYSWKLCALKYLQGDTESIANNYVQGVQQMRRVKFTQRIPKVMQPLCFHTGEKILHKAIKDIDPIIQASGWRVRFVNNLLQGNTVGLLHERAVLTFRWEYPFVYNPGACMNTAVRNYTNNIARDSGSKCRQVFIGKKSEGTLTSILVHDYTKEISSTFIEDDISIDFASMNPIDQKVVYAILTMTDMVGEELVSCLHKTLQESEVTIRESINRIGLYIRSGNIADPIPEFTYTGW